MNLKSFPGVVLAGERPFSNLDMPADSPFRCSHWFRMEFDTPREYANKQAWLHFLGINYRANIWVNGKKIADRADVAGAYRAYEFNINELAASQAERARGGSVCAGENRSRPHLGGLESHASR